MDWRSLFEQQFEKINRVYKANSDATSSNLADMLSTIMEGGIMVSRALTDPSILVRQLLEYRSYLELLYRPSS